MCTNVYNDLNCFLSERCGQWATCFVLQGKEADADRCKKALAEDSRSDHIMLIKAYKVNTHFIILSIFQSLHMYAA